MSKRIDLALPAVLVREGLVRGGFFRATRSMFHRGVHRFPRQRDAGNNHAYPSKYNYPEL